MRAISRIRHGKGDHSLPQQESAADEQLLHRVFDGRSSPCRLD